MSGVCVVYYSRSGRTEYVAKVLKELLEGEGFSVDLFRVRPIRDYGGLLYVNPRAIYDTLTGRIIEIERLEGFNPDDYDVVVIGSPVWFNNITPPIRSFIELFKGKISKPIICFTTSNIRREYSKKFKKLLKSLGYRVVLDFSITKLKECRRILPSVVEFIKGMFK